MEIADIIATNGACLMTRPPSPDHRRLEPEEFVATLTWKLTAITWIQEGRRNIYGRDAADEYPMGHTPPEMVQAHKARTEQLLEKWAGSNPSDSSDVSDISSEDEQLPPRRRPQAAQSTSSRRILAKKRLRKSNPLQTKTGDADISRVPTPPLSTTAESPPSHRTKRRRREVQVESEEKTGRRSGVDGTIPAIKRRRISRSATEHYPTSETPCSTTSI